MIIMMNKYNDVNNEYQVWEKNAKAYEREDKGRKNVLETHQHIGRHFLRIHPQVTKPGWPLLAYEQNPDWQRNENVQHVKCNLVSFPFEHSCK